MNESSSKQFEFSCPFCLRPIKAGVKASGKQFPCPGCGKEITVPTIEEAQWDAVHEPPSGDEYGLTEPLERTKYTPTFNTNTEEPSYQSELDNNYSISQSSYQPADTSKSKAIPDDEELIAERPKLPPHPMTTGIFSMFADSSAIMWFITLMICYAILIGLLTVPVLAFAGKVEGGMLALGAVFNGVGAVLGIAIFLFASNCFLSILQDSAAGNDIIESWPDKTGGAFSFGGIAYTFAAFFYSNGIGLIFAWPLRNQGLNWFPVLVGICFFAFPFILVSALEVGSPMVPISMNIVRSLFARFMTWVTFYIESAIILAIGFGTASFLTSVIGDNPKTLAITLGVVLGPLFTFLLFIYFRLLGRLVWVCDEWFRSLEPEDEEETEEDEWEEL